MLLLSPKSEMSYIRGTTGLSIAYEVNCKAASVARKLPLRKLHEISRWTTETRRHLNALLYSTSWKSTRERPRSSANTHSD